MKNIIISSVMLLFFTCVDNLSFVHCDSRNGPVVKAAMESLRLNNVKLVLIWVQEKDESLVKSAFAKTMAIRKISKEVQELSDEYFFETIVRLHRTGEGESYTGLKDEVAEPAVLLAEKAIERKSVDSLLNELTALMQQGLDQHLLVAGITSFYDPGNIKAGREYVANYLKFIEYVKGLYDASDSKNTEYKEPEQKHNQVNALTSDGQLNTPGWGNNQFGILLISMVILVALLVTIVLALDKILLHKNRHHHFTNGIAQHLA
jgi:hypothetical protein